MDHIYTRWHNPHVYATLSLSLSLFVGGFRVWFQWLGQILCTMCCLSIPKDPTFITSPWSLCFALYLSSAAHAPSSCPASLASPKNSPSPPQTTASTSRHTTRPMTRSYTAVLSVLHLAPCDAVFSKNTPCVDVMARSLTLTPHRSGMRKYWTVLKDWDLRTRTESRTKEEADPTCHVLFFQLSSFSVAGLCWQAFIILTIWGRWVAWPRQMLVIIYIYIEIVIFFFNGNSDSYLENSHPKCQML